MERRVDNGKLEIVIRLDGITQVLDRVDATINKMNEEVKKFQGKCKQTEEALSELKDKFLSIWA